MVSSPPHGGVLSRALPVWEAETFATWIADRNTEAGASGVLADRALQDRNWAYGHVIVDEAQEPSAMAWRMVLRRCPARSMTVGGRSAVATAMTDGRRGGVVCGDELTLLGATIDLGPHPLRGRLLPLGLGLDRILRRWDRGVRRILCDLRPQPG